MKKINRSKIEKALQNDMIVKITSLCLAILLYITITGVGTPFWYDFFNSKLHVDSIPLKVDYDESKYVIDGMPETISVDVSGSKSNIETFQRQQGNAVATLDLSYYEPGEYSIDSDSIKFNSNLANVRINPVASVFNVSLQEKVTESRSIDVSYINGEGMSDNGYMLSTPVLSSQAVMVTGGSEDVKSIVSVRGFIDLSKLDPGESSGEKTYDVSLVPYDEEGQVVSNINLSTPSITVTQDYEISSIELPVEYEFINNNTGKYVSSICDASSDAKCSESVTPTVHVYGDRTKIAKMDHVTYQIDLTDFQGDSGEVVGTPILESGVYILGESQSKYNINLELGKTKKIEGVRVTTYGLNPIYQPTVSSANQATVDVTVTGASSVVDSINKDSIVLEINLSDVVGAGTYTVPIELTRKNNVYFDYELSRDTTTVEIAEK